jgi:hypothetical protein
MERSRGARDPQVGARSAVDLLATFPGSRFEAGPHHQQLEGAAQHGVERDLDRDT